MEIVFIDDVLKQQGTLLDCKSNLVDFGIYDKENKRFRYKIVNIDKDCFKNVLNQADSSDNQDTTSSYSSSDIYRILYYLMKNDNDSVMYELSITSHQSGIAESDSLLEDIVASFRYFD